MSATLLRRLIEERATDWNQYQEVLDRANGDDGLSDEDRQQLDRLEEAISSRSQDIDRLQRGAALHAELARVEPPPTSAAVEPTESDDDRRENYRRAWVEYVRSGITGLETELRQVLTQGQMSRAEMRALGVATDAAGGYLVPQGFETRLIETMKAFGPMLDVAEVITTASGNSLEWPTVDDTANVGAILAENTQVTEQDVVLGTKTLDAYMYTSKLVRVSLQLLNDDAVDVEDLLVRLLGTRIGRILNQHFTTGTGTAQPDGIVTTATVGVTLPTGNTTTVTTDGLIDLVHSIDPAYRTAGARFMMNDTTIKAVRKLKDTTNQYLWQPGLQTGQPDSLLGYPISINQDMASPAASAKTVVFGDIRAGYIIRRVQGIQNLRLSERYADFLQVGFLAFARFDGTLNDGAAVRVLQQSAT